MWCGEGCNIGSAVTGIWVRVCVVCLPPLSLSLRDVIEYEDVIWKEQIMCSKWMQVQLRLGGTLLFFMNKCS